MSLEKKSVISPIVVCPACSFRRTIPSQKYEPGSSLKCPQCGAVFPFQHRLSFELHDFADIHPDALMHPLDKTAIAALRKIPGLDFAVRKMMEYSYEKIIRVNAMADDVKVTTKTCGYIHDMAEHAAKSLGISLPDVYIDQDPFPNAMTIGTEFPLIIIHTGLIELLTEDELYCVIAHEIGHIKCHHVLYHMLADFLVRSASALGVAGYAIIPLNLALLEWSRKSEFSADRAALLVTDNKGAVIKTLMKLAGGSARIADMIDEDEFVAQAEQFGKLTEGIGLNKFYKFASTVTRTHPFPALRGYEISKWASGDEYAAIRSGRYVKRSSAENAAQSRACPQCGRSLAPESVYCEACGQAAERTANQYDKSGAAELFGLFEKAKSGVKNIYHDFTGNTAGRVCPRCRAVYTDPAVLFCAKDGVELV